MDLDTINSVDLAWEKAIKHPDYDPDQARVDICGNVIYKAAFNDHSSPFGWTINVVDHKEGRDSITNLRPMQWENNITASDPSIIGNCNC